MDGFKFSLGQVVNLVDSHESGTVRSRSESLDYGIQYLVRYVDRTGCQKTDWFPESALCAA